MIWGGTAPARLVWMPSSSGGASTPIWSAMIAPQSPPLCHEAVVAEALHELDPAQRRCGPDPTPWCVGLPENP